MAANEKIKTRCPACGAKYYVPAQSVGHRARCAKCETVFKVTDRSQDTSHRPTAAPSTRAQRPSLAPKNGDVTARQSGDRPAVPARRTLNRPPTEEDILRWLSEGDDDDEVAVRPQVIDAGTARPKSIDPKLRRSASPVRRTISTPSSDSRIDTSPPGGTLHLRVVNSRLSEDDAAPVAQRRVG